SVASTCTADVASEVGRTPLWLAGGADGAANPESGAAGIAGCPVLSRLDASGARSMAEAGWLIAGAAATTLVRKSNWLMAKSSRFCGDFEMSNVIWAMLAVSLLMPMKIAELSAALVPV